LHTSVGISVLTGRPTHRADEPPSNCVRFLHQCSSTHARAKKWAVSPPKVGHGQTAEPQPGSVLSCSGLHKGDTPGESKFP